MSQSFQYLTQYLESLQPFLKHYQPIINVAAMLLATVLLLKWIRTKRNQLTKTSENPIATVSPVKNTYALSSADIKMVAGEDVITTQLDLARAYIELGKKHLAKSILHHVTKSGKPDQQQEAEKLMSTL